MLRTLAAPPACYVSACHALQVVCSTYYSFCGNASPGLGLASLVVTPGRNTSQPNLDWKEAVCHKWLHPVSASSHSAFTRWVIYGEAASNETQAGAAAADAGNRLWRSPAAAANASDSTLQIDFPLDGKVRRVLGCLCAAGSVMWQQGGGVTDQVWASVVATRP